MIPGLLDYIIENHKKETTEAMATQLGTSVQYVEAVCYHNDLTPRNYHWTDEEIAILKAKYAERPWAELFEHFPNRNQATIRAKASELGLRRRKFEPVNQ